jgi:hypothetical protein
MAEAIFLQVEAHTTIACEPLVNESSSFSQTRRHAGRRGC